MNDQRPAISDQVQTPMIAIPLLFACNAARRSLLAPRYPISTFTIAFPIPTNAAPEISPAQIDS